MSRICELTGKKPSAGNNVSHSQVKTKRRFSPNLQSKKYAFPKLGKNMRLTLSTKAIRSINKHGDIEITLIKSNDKNLSQRLLKAKSDLLKIA